MLLTKLALIRKHGAISLASRHSLHRRQDRFIAFNQAIDHGDGITVLEGRAVVLASAHSQEGYARCFGCYPVEGCIPNDQ